METIAIKRSNQKKLVSHVKKIKGQLKKGLELKKDIKVAKAKGKSNDNRGVVYLGHIPHGFYEDEIQAYCSQFGRVTRVRVARSKKTGRSKGYAFVEFQHPEVAKIVSETINNYLMFNRLLTCQYISPEKRHGKMFWKQITASRFPAQRNREQDTSRKNGPQDAGKDDERKQKKRRKIEDFKKFFEERGIEFNFKVNDPNDELSAEQTPPAVLEIDESDDEVEFNTPLHVTKVFKKNTSSKSTRVLGKTSPVRMNSAKKTLKPKQKTSGKASGAASPAGNKLNGIAKPKGGNKLKASH